jgi:two-component system, NtrC family, sensor kinase
MRPSRFGLQGKIIIIIAIAVVSVVGVSTMIAMVLTRQLVEEDTYRKALAQAKAIVHQIVDEHALLSPPLLLNALKQMEHDFPSIKDANVYVHDPTHRLVVSTDPTGPNLELDNIPGVEHYNEYEQADKDQITIETPDGRYWIMGTTIRAGGREIGCLNLTVSKSHMTAITRQLVLQNLLVTLAGLAFLMLIIHIVFLKGVRGPVKEMIGVMESAEGGSLSVRAPMRRRDEIGELAGHLNRMLDRIENFSAELGRKVEDATATLARRNEQLKRINEELFETRKTLARSERLAVAGQLAAALAHEIGTPLNSISGHVQLLARQSAETPSIARRLLVIERQIDNIVRTVKQLLSWTRRFDMKFEQVDLERLLEESLLLSSPTLQHRKIEVETRWAPGCPRIYGDPGYFQQVFLNLINNSMDAMARGGKLTVTLDGPRGENGREVSIVFEDTGMGIDAENLRRIFEPMFTTKRFGTGAGLGLAICDQIIRQHGGSIRVESQPGRGTRFTILLPADCRVEASVATGPVVKTTA